jgi:hypothetical protein
MIRIDVHPAGKNPIHTTYTFFVPVNICHLYAFYEQFLYMTTFR